MNETPHVFPRGIIATFYHPACIIVNFALACLLLVHVSQVRDVAYGPLVLIVCLCMCGVSCHVHVDTGFIM